MRKLKTGAKALGLAAALVAVSLTNALAVTATASAQDSTAAQDTTTTMAAEKSLYERLGGEAAISAVVDDFVARVAADARINMKFARSNVERVKFHLKEQVCAATGGPCQYTGLSMGDAHKNMKVTEGEFNALVEDLVATLDKFNVPAREKGELLSALGGLKSQIVEVGTQETGTPLPAEFKPAKPLPKGKLAKGPFPKSKMKSKTKTNGSM
ncbi:MAG TPA: group 1 truncated hemoglobin [Pyrinomonadaceae bacterium]|nr:group 1 truncated hemoglobin [Pyrinomonadaceae bacterium]